MTQEVIRLRIKRQDSPDSKSYFEEFNLPYRKNMNITAVLMEIQKNPVNAKGEKTTAVVWECVCLEEVCGSCSMLVNGKPAQACSSLIDKLEQPITIAPLSSFPIIRDLKVDRKRMFDALKEVKAWIPIDGTYDLGPGPRMSSETQAWAYELSKCMTCGVCMEACPNVNEHSDFMGPAPIQQVRLFNAHPTGAMNKAERLRAIMQPGGITSCGNSQNCVRACPKGIPLTTSLAHLNRETTVQSLKDFFGSYK